MSRRAGLLTQLRHQSFDLLVIGGGIVGAGIARDGAMRGLRVALIDQGDFAGGASSKTSKLIHGGLRYLEHGQWRLVFESVRERSILRTIAPQLVWPLTISIPVYRGDSRSRGRIALGLGLYDVLSLHRGLGPHRMRSAREIVRQDPGLNPAGLRGAGSYLDCQMDDARLCLTNIVQAVSFGAVCGNYVRLRSFLRHDDRLIGAVVEDLRSSQSFEVRARAVVNATGPWSDRVRRLSDPDAPTRLNPTKGIHVILPRLAHQALFFQARRDGRMIFLLPWGAYSLLGTTESGDVGELDALRASHDEVEYLLEEVSRVVPEARKRVRESGIIGTFAGARPLLAFAGSSTRASREHRLEIDRYGLVSIMGGKYTTYRLMAKQTLDAVVTRFRFKAERCLTDQVGLLEPVHPVILGRWQEVTARIDPALLARLLIRYGTGAFRILELIEFEPGLLQPVCPHHDLIQAELVYAIREELACTISDVLVRRTTIAYSACQGLDLLSTLTDLFHRYGHCTHTELAEQVDSYQQFLAASLACWPAASSVVPV